MIPKDFFPNPEGTIGFAVHRLAFAMERQLNQLFQDHKIDMDTNMWGVLYYIFKNESLPVDIFPQKFLLPELKIQEITEQLQERRLALLQSSDEDSDKKSLVLTLKGKTLVFSLMPILFKSLTTLRKDIDPSEMLITVNCLNKIYCNLYPKEELYELEAPPFVNSKN